MEAIPLGLAPTVPVFAVSFPHKKIIIDRMIVISLKEKRFPKDVLIT